MPTPPVILLLSGSLRSGSSNETVLRTAQAVAASEVRTVLYGGLAALPHFNPDDDTDPLPGPVAELRAAIDGADAVLVCTPEYAGTLPGAFKNLLDWTVGGTEICDKPTAWVNAAAPGRGQGAEATLRTVLGYTGADIVELALRTDLRGPQHGRTGRGHHRSGRPRAAGAGARTADGAGRGGRAGVGGPRFRTAPPPRLPRFVPRFRPRPVLSSSMCSAVHRRSPSGRRGSRRGRPGTRPGGCRAVPPARWTSGT